MEAVEKASGKRPAELDQPEFPPGMTHFIEWLCRLPRGFTWREVDAWLRVTRRELELWEIDLLFELDRMRRE